MLYWLRATLWPRREGKPAPEFQALIAKAVNEPCPMVIQWDKGGYAIDVTHLHPGRSNGDVIVILGKSRTYPLSTDTTPDEEPNDLSDFRDGSNYVQTLTAPRSSVDETSGYFRDGC